MKRAHAGLPDPDKLPPAAYVIKKACQRLIHYTRREIVLFPSLERCPVDGRFPRQRSQYVPRRHACMLVLAQKLRTLDLVTMRVGVNDAGDVLGMRLDTIAEATGLDNRRVDRAVRDLRNAGMLKSHRRAEPVNEGQYIGRTSVRVIADDVFAALGLGKHLARARKHFSALASARQTTRKADPAKQARVRLALKGAAAMVDARHYAGPAVRPSPAAGAGDALAVGRYLGLPPPQAR